MGYEATLVLAGAFGGIPIGMVFGIVVTLGAKKEDRKRLQYERENNQD